nr:peptidase inhibitor family I36 protein [Kibdelosporangium sp. MJ126-NF4]CEL21901.1 hypothetical protein [Kibdelosporangium sp. MJ126-NF4]CTQ92680.1 hypothetical protein [Kibdelosporangium sp. MJ126-NF4]
MRAIKIFLTVTALTFAMGAAPGTASADKSPSTDTAMPQVATTCHESGLTFYCKTIQSGPIACPDGWVCLYTDANFRGMQVRWPAGNHHPNFTSITCQSGGSSVNCPHGSGQDFNDEASSWANFTNRLYCINWDTRPGLNNDMPVGSQGNIGGGWNDEASALSSSGCLP